MTAAIIAIVVVVALVLLFALFLVASYRSLAQLAGRTDEGWRDIVALLRRRAELVPQVVAAVREYESPSQRGALATLSEAGSATTTASTPTEASAAENHLQQALRIVLRDAEAYPKLESGPAFLALRSELADSAEQIQASRRFYNGGVREFNAKIQVFPNSMFAKRDGFGPREFFEAADTTARAEPPRVQF